MKSVLRRHGKIIMTILGVTLMIVFAMPAFNTGRDNSGDTVGHIDGTRITNNDIAYAQREMSLIRDTGREYLIADLELDERAPTTHWILLIREARKYGFGSVGITYQDVEQSLSQGYPPFIPSFKPSDLQDLLNRTGDRKETLVAAYTHLDMIQQLRNFAFSLPQPVTAVELLADKQLTKVKIAYATLDAIKNAPTTAPSISTDAVQKQFDTYKSVVATRVPENPVEPLPPLPPEINGHRYPFGYKYPDRVKVEYLVFDRVKMRELIKETAADYDEAYKYYIEHPAEFSIAATPGTLTTQPAKRAFDEVKRDLVNRQIDARITKLIDRMYDRILAAAEEPRRKAPMDDKGNIEVPPQDKWAHYERLADEISKNRDFLGYKPEYHALTQWMDELSLAQVPGIGSATTGSSDRSTELTFPALATHVRELKTVSPREAIGRITLQRGIEGPKLRDRAGNVYLYRVTDAAKTAEPATLEEVRPQVERDLRLLASYEAQQQAARDLAAAANNGDLAALAASRNIPVETTPEFSRMDTELPAAVQNITGFVDRAYSLVPRRNTGTTRPSTQPAGVRSVTTLENDNTLRVYALQLLTIMPAQPRDFADKRSQLLRQPEEGLRKFADEWFALEAISHRMKYVPLMPLGKKGEGESAAAD